MVGSIENSILGDEDDDDSFQNDTKGAIKELKMALKDEERMRQFDKLCSSMYGISSEIAENQNEDDFDIDNHLNAKS